ncbi:uncharacterized protein LOC121413296 [Lytechinus variegatus]|uniref:uncharacterized protein LOC121413296 n=1 Tax=Lytechinus variegatus TaxID=7654 RepID=UPI001BB19653|nr:uncharacterized protein LOC121413296 [Lytechinus variegatus]
MATDMSKGYEIPFKEKLKCSICRDRIKDARSLPCGHTYCSDCLKRSADATYPRGSIDCSECKKKFQLDYSGAEGLPRCFATNILVEDINETFGGVGGATASSRGGSTTSSGGDDQLSLGKHRFEVEKIFSCPICLDLMRDARYLPCGHSYCRECLKQCLEVRSRRSNGIACGKCQKDHRLPDGGIDALPVAYRINNIVAEIRSNDTGGDVPKASSSSKTSHYKNSQPCHSSDTRSRPDVEDVDEAKKMAQAQVGNHSHQSPGTRSRPDMEDVEEAKKRAQTQASTNCSRQQPGTKSEPTMGAQAGYTRVRTPYSYRPGTTYTTTTTPRSDPTIEIMVRDFNGKTHIVRVRPTDTVKYLKSKIEEKVKVSPSQQQLTFQGKTLMNDAKVSSCGLQNLSTVQMQGRLMGGKDYMHRAGFV